MGFVRKVDFVLLFDEGIMSSSEREAKQDGNYSARWKIAGNGGGTATWPDQPWMFPITELPS